MWLLFIRLCWLLGFYYSLISKFWKWGKVVCLKAFSKCHIYITSNTIATIKGDT